MPVPWFFIHCGGNQHVSFTLDLWWPGRKLMGRTPAWKINCAYLVSANGEILHWEAENGGGSTSFLPSSNTCCQYFFLQIFCLGRDDVGKCSDVAVFMWKYIYTHTHMCVWLCVLVEFQVHWELMNSVTGESTSVSVSHSLGKGTQQISAVQWVLQTLSSALPEQLSVSQHYLLLHISRCTLKYWGIFWMGITLPWQPENPRVMLKPWN